MLPGFTASDQKAGVGMVSSLLRTLGLRPADVAKGNSDGTGATAGVDHPRRTKSVGTHDARETWRLARTKNLPSARAHG